MERVAGTVTRGLRGPIINEGDSIEEIVVDTVLRVAEVDGFFIQDRDSVTITESIVASAQGKYASLDTISKGIQTKYPDGTVGVISPVLSRNRFSNILSGIARGSKHVVLMLSYPADEVGNQL